MAVELVAGHGVRIDGFPDLTYGLTGAEVCDLVERRTRLHRTWGCGLTWSFGWHLDGVSVQAGGGPDRLADTFAVSRRTVFYRAGREGLAAHEPVVFAGVDVFEWTAEEVVACLRSDGHEVSERTQIVRVGAELCLYRWDGPGRPFTDAWLSRPYPDDPDAPQYRI
ncbi:hypothetical protein Cs7R123_00250 [Catellatospora sp. TT07R-123]|uniref:hypothetical protein n=1 Tax=Catellatospora sp. TT07R-123 TaxID=2733863 RepID=UPI001B1818FC|nr:hypothetical protein [Catellatospora sp. TT07R-123]GHJ42683.1 hypothetical protein Cs7R123_00250 [Catellatospora sp. TT07R-123]